MVNPYDELPYRSFPIEWTAPERLAVTSLLHGGPRLRLDRPYRVLELGCGNGANLIPLAYFRRHASFVGVDSAASQVTEAQRAQASLGLENVTFACGEFSHMEGQLDTGFDVVLVHGVVSWVSAPVRDRLLDLCASRLSPQGLLYVNYNCRPGWNVRGLVREFLLSMTSAATNLRSRIEAAQGLALRLAAELHAGQHPFSRLLANEFRFAGESEPSYAAHEYLAEDNHPYTRAEFLHLLRPRGLSYVADADFSYPSGRLPETLDSKLAELEIPAARKDEVADLLCYRQLHSPILTHTARRQPPASDELTSLRLLSSLVETEPDDAYARFRHPSGHEVTVRDPVIADTLRQAGRSPEGVRLGEVLPEPLTVIEDLTLLHRNGMIELWYWNEPSRVDAAALHQHERRAGYVTSRFHTVTAEDRSSPSIS